MPEATGNVRRAGVTITLSASAAIGVFLLFLAPLFALSTPVIADNPLAEPQQQSAESALFFLGFLVIVPLSAIFVPGFVDRVAEGREPAALNGLAALTVTGQALTILLLRLSGAFAWGGGLWLLFALTVAWFLVFVPVWLRLADRKRNLPEVLGRSSRGLTGVAWITAAGALLCLGEIAHIDLPWLAGGLLLACAVLLVWASGWSWKPSARLGLTFDGLVLLLILLAVPDLVVMRGPLESNLPADTFATYVMQGHEALFLGALSQVGHGSVLLVDTVSQYGIGSIYLLAAWFELVPMNNGTLAFFDAVLSALMFAGGYAILRLAGVGRLLATSALAVAVITLVYGLEYPIGGLLQHGGLRFGLPVPLILFWVAATRLKQGRRFWELAGWAVVGLSSVWALEAFMYVSGAAVSMIALRAAVAEPGRRIATLLRGAGAMVLSWAAFQAVFAIATLAVSGQLPDWGLYLTYLRDFLTGDVGDITYDVPAWSPGIAVGIAWGVAAIALISIVIRNPGWSRQNLPALVSLAGLTGFGIFLFSYFDNRSLPHVLPYLCLPLVLTGAVWLNLILRSGNLGRWVKGVALASALALSALSVSISMPLASDRAGNTLLAYAVPGGSSARFALERLWNMPEMVEGADQGAALLEEYMPGEDRTPIITRPDLDVAILMRADRANALGITDAKEASWVPGPHIAAIDRAVGELAPGDRMLLDEGALESFRQLSRDPQTDPDLLYERAALEPIQVRALARIAARFRLTTVARRDGFVVVELEPRN